MALWKKDDAEQALWFTRHSSSLSLGIVRRHYREPFDSSCDEITGGLLKYYRDDRAIYSSRWALILVYEACETV